MSRIARCAGIGLLLAGMEAGAADKPMIAVFSGPTATIQNSGAPLITSNKARAELGLPLLKGKDGEPLKYDKLYMQRLAVPVTVYVEQFSAHPLEADVAELYAPAHGYIDATGKFTRERKSPGDKAVYAMTLKPEDGLYPLPYAAVQADGKAWDDSAAYPGAPFEKIRQQFYPDASRILDEIERNGGRINELASFHFYRAAPAGGYTKGISGGKRTDQGTGDIPPEKRGVDFFRYGEHPANPPRGRLAIATNIVQKAMGSGNYQGGIWLEGSPNVEETSWWLNLAIDTDKPIVVHSAQRARGYVSADGDGNIVTGIKYILGKEWADGGGKNRLGGVLLVDNVLFSSREVQKGDARPGGYVASGGFGGILGTVENSGHTEITFIPNRKHSYTSDVRVTKLPTETMGLARKSGKITPVKVAIKDASGALLPTAIPFVSIVKSSRWRDTDTFAPGETEVDVMARIEENLKSEPLSGFVQEGWTGGGLTYPVEEALKRAVVTGFPVVKVNRGNPHGFVDGGDDDLYIEGSNLTSTKARLLLMASLMKLGSLPAAADPKKPTPAELTAIKTKIREYQEIFDSH